MRVDLGLQRLNLRHAELVSRRRLLIHQRLDLVDHPVISTGKLTDFVPVFCIRQLFKRTDLFVCRMNRHL